MKFRIGMIVKLFGITKDAVSKYQAERGDDGHVSVAEWIEIAAVVLDGAVEAELVPVAYSEVAALAHKAMLATVRVMGESTTD
jgi:hypothetical protein